MNNEVADTEWVENFRMLRTSFFDLATILAPYLQTKIRNPIAVECQVVIFLYYLSEEGRYQKTANAFGISRSSVSILIQKVAKILAEHLGPELIKLPKPVTEVEALNENFLNARSFPQCLAAIDGTHMHIKQPSPPGMQRRSDVSVRSRIGWDIADQAEMSSQRCNRYVNETDLFETSMRHLTGTKKKPTYLRRHKDVPIDTYVRLINLTHRRDIITGT